MIPILYMGYDILLKVAEAIMSLRGEALFQTQLTEEVLLLRSGHCPDPRLNSMISWWSFFSILLNKAWGTIYFATIKYFRFRPSIPLEVESRPGLNGPATSAVRT